MREASRAYNLLRAYVGREWDRISGLDEDLARRELDQATGRSRPLEEVPATPDAPASEPILVPADPEARKRYARSLLGVAEDASFKELRAAFTRLNKRCDASNFPADSSEANHAAQIQKKLHWAFATLTEGMSDTERRFKSLEI